MLSLDNLHSFDQQNYSNIIWAFATANITHCQLFKTVEAHVVEDIDVASLDADASLNLLGALKKAEEVMSKKDAVNLEKTPF